MSTAPVATTQPDRLVSLDAYRGLTMLAMASGGLGLHQVALKANQMRCRGQPERALEIVGYQFEQARRRSAAPSGT